MEGRREKRRYRGLRKIMNLIKKKAEECNNNIYIKNYYIFRNKKEICIMNEVLYKIIEKKVVSIIAKIMKLSEEVEIIYQEKKTEEDIMVNGEKQSIEKKSGVKVSIIKKLKGGLISNYRVKKVNRYPLLIVIMHNEKRYKLLLESSRVNIPVVTPLQDEKYIRKIDYPLLKKINIINIKLYIILAKKQVKVWNYKKYYRIQKLKNLKLRINKKKNKLKEIINLIEKKKRRERLKGKNRVGNEFRMRSGNDFLIKKVKINKLNKIRFKKKYKIEIRLQKSKYKEKVYLRYNKYKIRLKKIKYKGDKKKKYKGDKKKKYKGDKKIKYKGDKKKKYKGDKKIKYIRDKKKKYKGDKKIKYIRDKKKKYIGVEERN